MTANKAQLQAAITEKKRRDALKAAEQEKRTRHTKEEGQKNVADWIESNITIEDPQAVSRGEPTIFPFKMWPEQRDTLEKIQNNKQVIIVKSRQLGISWLVQAFALWLILFNPNTRVIIVSKDLDAAKEVIRRIKGMYERLSTRPTESTEPWNLKEINFKNGSGIRAIAPRKGAGASYTASFIILDEFANIPFAQNVYAAIKPTIDDGGKMVVLSTAEEGESGDMFESLFRSAEGGSSGFVPIFLPWSVRPSRTVEWYEKEYFDAPDKKLFLKMYPSSVDEAFSNVGDTAFISEEDWEDAYSEILSGTVESGKAFNGCDYVLWKSKAYTSKSRMVWSLDGSVNSDSTCLCGTGLYPEDKSKYAVLYMLIYYPTKEHPIDFAHVENQSLIAWRGSIGQAFYYDTYQLSDLGQRIEGKGIPALPFSQQRKRVEADSLLRSSTVARLIKHGGFEVLDEHIFNVRAKDKGNKQIRIEKSKRELKIDAAVALSMSLYILAEKAVEMRLAEDRPITVNTSGQRIVEREPSQYRMGLSTDPSRGLVFGGLPSKLGAE